MTPPEGDTRWVARRSRFGLIRPLVHRQAGVTALCEVRNKGVNYVLVRFHAHRRGIPNTLML